jgi:hypothetical protein
MQDLGDTVRAARKVTDQAGRIVDRVEKDRVSRTTLLYEEPVALRRINDLITSTQSILARVERGEGQWAC